MTSRGPAKSAAGFALGKVEWALVVFAFVVLTALVAPYLLSRAYNQHADATMMYQIIDSVGQHGRAWTTVTPSIMDALKGWGSPPAEVCALPLLPSFEGNWDYLNYHAVFFVYILALFGYLLAPPTVASLTTAVCFVGLIIGAYWFVRRLGAPVVAAMLFAALVVVHPAWSASMIGDYYFDRFFMVFAFLFAGGVYLALRDGGSLAGRQGTWIAMMGVVAASTNDRSALFIGIVSLMMMVVYWTKFSSNRDRLRLFVYGIAMLAYAVLYAKLMAIYTHGTGFSIEEVLVRSWAQFVAIFTDPRAQSLSLRYVTVNVLLFGILAIFDWRAAVIGGLILVPNLMASVGGAEKTGFATHYHSQYFPFLAFAAAIGYARLWAWARRARQKQTGLILATFILGGLLTTSDYNAPQPFSFSTTPVISGAPYGLLRFYQTWQHQSVDYTAGLPTALTAALTPGATVTAVEAAMPAIHNGRSLFYYPMNLERADYAVLFKRMRSDGSPVYGGAISYLGQANELDECLNQRLRGAGYDLDNPTIIGSYAVLKRSQPQ